MFLIALQRLQPNYNSRQNKTGLRYLSKEVVVSSSLRFIIRISLKSFHIFTQCTSKWNMQTSSILRTWYQQRSQAKIVIKLLHIIADTFARGPTYIITECERLRVNTNICLRPEVSLGSVCQHLSYNEVWYTYNYDSRQFLSDCCEYGRCIHILPRWL